MKTSTTEQYDNRNVIIQIANLKDAVAESGGEIAKKALVVANDAKATADRASAKVDTLDPKISDAVLDAADAKAQATAAAEQVAGITPDMKFTESNRLLELTINGKKTSATISGGSGGGGTGTVSINQGPEGITINDIALQDATLAQDGLMTKEMYQAVQTAGDATQLANEAKTLAEQAKTTADGVDAKAQQGIDDAATALAKGEDALASAEQANQSALTADGKAVLAQKDAEKAGLDATKAVGDATTALNTAKAVEEAVGNLNTTVGGYDQRIKDNTHAINWLSVSNDSEFKPLEGVLSLKLDGESSVAKELYIAPRYYSFNSLADMVKIKATAGDFVEVLALQPHPTMGDVHEGLVSVSGTINKDFDDIVCGCSGVATYTVGGQYKGMGFVHVLHTGGGTFYIYMFDTKEVKMVVCDTNISEYLSGHVLKMNSIVGWASDIPDPQ